MKLFSEKVQPTFTNSTFNVLQIENFSEIFFDVYEIELNKIKYPAEKISSFRGNPVVSVPVVIGEKEQEFPFVLIKGKESVFFNESNSEVPIDDTPIEVVDTDVLFESVDIDHDYRIKEDTKREIMEHIETAKANARKQAEAIKREKLKEADAEIRKKNKLLRESLDTAKQQLVKEFISITKSIKRELINEADGKYSELTLTIDNKINDLADTLAESIQSDFENSSKELETNIRAFVKAIHNESVLPELRKSLETIATDAVVRIKGIESDLDKKLDEKVDVSVLQELSSELSALRNTNVELNNNINKGVNKALSRIGNVNNRIDEVSSDVIKQLDEKISTTADNISNYYSEKLKSLEDQTFDLNEKSRQYVVDIVRESRDNLISEIRKIQKEAPVEFVIESAGKKKTKSFDSIQKDIDKKISDRVSDEVIKLRKYIAVYSSGGGTVAQQFADGGTMNGNLTVVGAISASQYLGIPGGGGVSGDYLPLSGGTINGNLNVNGTVQLSGSDFTASVDNQINLFSNSGLTLKSTGFSTAIDLKAPSVTINHPTDPTLAYLQVDGLIQGLEIYSPDAIRTDTVEIGSDNLYFTNSTGFIAFGGQSRIANSSNGVIRLTNNIASTFNRLQFGGVTTAFPAIKRNGSGIDIVNAADTGFTDLRARNITASGTISASAYLGLPAISGDYLPLSGGIIDGDFTVNGNVTALSGANITGDTTITGNLTAESYSFPDIDSELTTSTNIRGWTYGTNASPTLPLADPQSVKFKPDGTVMYVLNSSNTASLRRVYAYNLSPAWDVSTSTTTPALSTPTVDLSPTGLEFSPDGKYMFILSTNTNRVKRYPMPVGSEWDISTITTPDSEISITALLSGATVLRGLAFKTDGAKMYVFSDNTNLTYEFDLITPWDVSTATYTSGSAILTPNNTQDITISSDGKRFFTMDNDNDRIFEYALQTPWRISSAVFDGRMFYSTSDSTNGPVQTENTPSGIYFNDVEGRCFFVGTARDRVQEVLVNQRTALIGTAPMILANPAKVTDRVIVNSLQISDTTGTAGATTGALVVAGGIGVGGEISCSLYGGTNVRMNTNGYIGFTNSSTMRTDGDGIMRFSNFAQTDFDKLRLGGQDTGFPAIKRNGSGIDIRDAADAGFTDLRARNITAAGSSTVLNLIAGGAPLSATSSITLALTDLGRVVRYSGVAAISATVPDQSTVAWPDGSVIYLRRNAGAGTITIQGSGGTIINDNISTSIPAGSMMAIRKVVDNEWDFI